jgi:hypothetical protein
MPQDIDVTLARVVCLDPFFSPPAFRVAETAFNAGIPIVTIDCKYDNHLLRQS